MAPFALPVSCLALVDGAGVVYYLMTQVRQNSRETTDAISFSKIFFFLQAAGGQDGMVEMWGCQTDQYDTIVSHIREELFLFCVGNKQIADNIRD